MKIIIFAHIKVCFALKGAVLLLIKLNKIARQAKLDCRAKTLCTKNVKCVIRRQKVYGKITFFRFMKKKWVKVENCGGK